MSVNNCTVCGKDIGPGNNLGKCSLCAIGLAPTSQLQRAEKIADYTGASGRTLSGDHCPGCKAELSMADISLKRCSICGDAFAPEMVSSTIHIRQTAEDITFPSYPSFPDSTGYK